MNEKDDKTFNRIARIAAPIGLPLFGISYLLGDTTIGRIFLSTGLTIWLGGGFVILLFLAFGAISSFQNRSLAGANDGQTREAIRKFPSQVWSAIRRGSSDLKDSSGFSPRIGYDPRVLKKSNLVLSMNEAGIALSARKEDVRVSRVLIAATVRLGNSLREYASTIERFEPSSSRIEPPILLPVNGDRVHTDAVNFFWHECRELDVLDIMLRAKLLRQRLEGKKVGGNGQTADIDLVALHPVFYDLSGDYLLEYESLIKLAQSASNGAVWYDREVWENLGVERWKGNSGSEYTVNRKRARIRFRTGSGVEVNRDVVSFKFNLEEYTILPDIIIQSGKKKFSLADAEIYSDVSGYVIPESKVPKGSVPTGHTWEYVNRDGSPDLRYNENERLAIIDVCEVAVAVTNDVLFSIVFSNVAAGKQIAQTLSRLCELTRAT